MKHQNIYVAYDKLECNTICAAPSMNEAITHVLRYMAIQEYICKEFCYDEWYTIITFEHDYRIGAELKHVEDIITIMETDLMTPD